MGAGEKYRRRRFPPRGLAEALPTLGVLLLAWGSVLYALSFVWPKTFAMVKRELIGGPAVASGVREPYLRLSGTTALERHARQLYDAGVDAHATHPNSVLHSVNGKRVVVLDDFIDERHRKRIANTYIKLSGGRSNSGWHRERASDLSEEHNAMARDMEYAECTGKVMTLLRRVVPLFYEECSAERPIWNTRCSIYMQNFADIDEAHTDHSHDDGAFSVTTIWYPHEQWHAGWGGETTFLDSADAAVADLVLPVLPKPRRMLLFDSTIPHMAKPATVIAEPFAPQHSSLVGGGLPTTRTTGNRFSFVTRVLCSRLTVEELVDAEDSNGDSKLDRREFTSLIDRLEIEQVAAMLRQAQNDLGRPTPYDAEDIKLILRVATKPSD